MINLYLTFRCNLRCKYCYLDNKLKYKKNAISTRTLIKFLDFLDYIGYFRKKEEERIMFIGGEPLYYPKKIFEFKRIINERYKNVKFHFQITSNLTLHQRELFKDKSFHFFVSLDGLKEAHDKNRVFPSGKGSFQIVLKNLQELIKYKKAISVISTFVPGKLPHHFTDFVAFLSNLSKNVFWEITIRPAIFSLNEENLNDVLKGYCEVFDYYLDKRKEGGVNFSISFIRTAFKEIKNIKEKGLTRTCGAGLTSFNLYPNGDLWPCEVYYILNRRKFGNVNLNSFQEISKELFKLRIFNMIMKRKAKERICDCPFEEICDKPVCLALFESNHFQCHPMNRLNAELLSKLMNYIKTRLSKQELEELIHEKSPDFRQVFL